MIAIALNKQQAPDANTKAIKKINFTQKLERGGNTTIFLILEGEKETILEPWEYCEFILL